jgi:uncharacterized coiled-coil protein SlyX
MASDLKLAANRRNARKSTGPKTNKGKRRSARNALSHGLAVPVRNISALRSDIETLGLSIALASGERTITELSRQAAEAQLEILRIREVRAAILATYTSYEELTKKLAGLERYERRAFSRRKRALRAL